MMVMKDPMSDMDKDGAFVGQSRWSMRLTTIHANLAAPNVLKASRESCISSGDIDRTQNTAKFHTEACLPKIASA